MKTTNIQSKEELDNWYKKDDPWNYEQSEDDRKRKTILLTEIPKLHYKKVLDIGCGEGYITRDLPGEEITGVDISFEAISRAQKNATDRIRFQQGDIFNLSKDFTGKQFDLIIITGVLYPQYIGHSETLVYKMVNEILAPGGILVSVHIDEWYNARFPYLLISDFSYPYREFFHKLEVYYK